MRQRIFLLALLVSACGEPLVVGSNVLWSADHESGNLSEWTSSDAGAAYASGDGAAVAVVTEQARSGTNSVKLTTPASGSDAISGVYRLWSGVKDAYYSAWYYLPRAYETTSYWTLMRFSPSLPGVPVEGTSSMDLNLRSLPDGQLALEIIQQRQAYLRWPMAIPAPIVPVEHWFQIEARFRSATDETGLLKVWLNGALVYDIQGRVTNLGDDVYFSPCNATHTLSPTPAEIYFDDVIVSLSRITPAGVR